MGTNIGRRLLLGILLALLLSACGVNINRSVTFYQDERWEAQMLITVPSETIVYTGSLEQLERDFDQYVREAEEQGANVSWNKREEDEAIRYTFEIEGQGYEALNEAVFGGDANIRTRVGENGELIDFSYFVGGDLLGANEHVLTLNGGSIVSSNGTPAGRGKVEWVNARGTLQATLRAKSGSVLGTVVGLALLGSIGAGGWYWWRKQQRLQPLPCAQCGEAIPATAKFCPYCGHIRQP